MKCENCAWAVWYYNEVVECCGGPCPSEADFEAAEKDRLFSYGWYGRRERRYVMTIYWKYTEACNGKPCCGDCDKCPIEPIGEVTLKSRVELLKKLHDIMMNMNDEDCYFRWITWVPDEPTEEDFKSIALDTEEFQQILQFFTMLFNEYRDEE